MSTKLSEEQWEAAKEAAVADVGWISDKGVALGFRELVSELELLRLERDGASDQLADLNRRLASLRAVLGQARRLIGSVGRHDEDPRSEYGRWSCWVCGRWIAERRGGMRYRYPHADTCEIGAALAALDAAMDECGPER